METMPMCSKEALDRHSEHPILKTFSAEEVDRIVQLKRFMEWFDGDPEFRREMESDEFSPKVIERLRRIGVMFHPEEVALLWKWPRLVGKERREEVCGLSEEQKETLQKALKEQPLVDLWVRFSTLAVEAFRKGRGCTGFSVPRSPKFDAWRTRRIASTRHELGHFSYVIDHPLLAFELGDGCSVGCWFCAFATRKLTQNFDYGRNREFFRKVVRICVDLFGREQAAMTLLYYGTEPHDNPDYLDFLNDHAEITGFASCTSTAACTDAAWIRKLIAYYRERLLPWPRLSVLSRKMLHEIHELYSPGELRDVGLLMQMKDHQRCKVTGGRILKESDGLREREEGHYTEGFVPQGSIACVTGFLINMVHQRIQLISPCYTSKLWPYGYRVFDEIFFDGPEDFERAVLELIDRSMPEAPPPHRIARFRDDLVYRQTEEGFDLVSPNQVRHFRGADLYGPLGSLLARGEYTFEELYRKSLDECGLNPLLVVSTVREVFDKGFLDEVYGKAEEAPENRDRALPS